MNNKDSRQIIIVIVVIIAVILTTYMMQNSNSNKNTSNKESENTKIETMTSNEPIVDFVFESISYDDKFGGVYVNMTIDDFNALGYEYGDSVNASFTNGYELLDIPYYNGYYVDFGEPLLVGYPGYPYIKLGINMGDDLWTVANLTSEDKCIITLNEKAKYLDVQKARNISYSDEQGDLSDEVFANFRPMNVGNLKENFVFRGASPIDNKHNRAPIVDRLISRENINFVVNLADNMEEVEAFKNKEDFNSPYFINLLNENKVTLLSMDANFKSDGFSQKLANGLTMMSQNEGPYYIHCQEGKDRTGYVCMIVEALAGASYKEIIDDYMKTYDNYYEINKETDLERYELIKLQNIDEMIYYIIGNRDIDLETANMQEYAKSYLLRIGMSEDSLNTLISKITK